MNRDKILDVKNISKRFSGSGKGIFSVSRDTVKAVDDVSISMVKGSTLGIVGESGSGKTTLARMIAGVLEPDSGSVNVSGKVDMVFQDPYGSLNPRMTIMDIIAEPLRIAGIKRKEIHGLVSKAVSRVHLSDDQKLLSRYPHQFSGGERQRISIARSIIREPELVVLDEPVSSLDVSIQAGIVNLLMDLQDELEMSYIFISHDMRVVEFISDVVAVMKSGRIVEVADKQSIYRNPRHEYTRHLIASVPNI